jgi:hypothetical protein
MTSSPQNITLGFTPKAFPPGIHVCQIFNDDEERLDGLLKFVCSGLQAGERTCCFSDNINEAVLAEFLGRQGISCQEKRGSGALTLAGTREVYFQNNCFDPERILNLLTQYHKESVAQGYPAARVIGEMSPEVGQLEGGDRLLEYEARVSLLLREYPVTAVCQYDARRFGGGTILDVLKVHPFMVMRGSVVHNPFALSPEEILATKCPGALAK